MSYQNNVNFSANQKRSQYYLEKLYANLSNRKKFLAKMINLKEGDSGLSHSRFAQCTITNWFPKALFSRSIADFSEVTFLEIFESALFFYLAPFMGEFLSRRKIFSHFLNKDLQKDISLPIQEILKHKQSGRLLPVKAAILLSCTIIPATEYVLSYAKNLFTLKVFKKTDFSNIVNLDKNKQEDPKHQAYVERSAKNHIKKATIVSIGAFGLSLLLGAFGHKSKAVQNLSSLIINPGAKINFLLEKIGVKSSGLKAFLEKYCNLDFAKKSDGSLGLGAGQLAFTVSAGVVGYFGAAKDRGKLDFMEVATRIPVVALYIIFGSTLLDNIFKKYLKNKNVYSDIIKLNAKNNELEVESLPNIYEKAEKLAKGDKKILKEKINILFNKKATVALVPFFFTIAVMGLLLSALNRFWTKYRYNKGIGNANYNSRSDNQLLYPYIHRTPEIFESFCKFQKT